MSQEPISCHCPKCGKTFRVPVELQGKKIVCKGCQTHFVVQGKSPGASHHPPAAAVGAVKKPAVAAAGAPPVVAATAAPAPLAPPPVDDLAPIPIDDLPVSLSGDASHPPPTVSTRDQKIEKIKIQSKGPYYVIKLYLTGKLIHVQIEDTLNEHAAEGWLLKEILTTPTGEAYAILFRDPAHRPSNAVVPPEPESSAETDIVPR